MLSRIKSYQASSAVYVLDMTKKEKRRCALRHLLYTLCAMLIHVAIGMINQPSSRTAWVVYPYLIVFLPLAYAVMGAFTFRSAGCRMSSIQYHEGILRIRRSLLAVFILEVIGIVLEIVFIVLHFGQIPLLREVIYIAFHIPQLVLIVAYSRYYDQTFVRITEEK